MTNKHIETVREAHEEISNNLHELSLHIIERELVKAEKALDALERELEGSNNANCDR